MSISTKQVISGLYAAFFNRAPDLNGLNYWEQQAQAGNELAVFVELGAGFAAHPKFAESYGEMNNQQFVEAIYINALGSAGDSQGISYWVNELDSGSSRSDMVVNFIYSALHIDLSGDREDLSTQEQADAIKRQDTIKNKADVGIFFTEKFGNATNIRLDDAIDKDPAYQASTEILSAVNHTTESVEAAKVKITLSDKGVVVDGYVSGATVFIDVNGNGQQDPGEPSTVTDALGNFDFGEDATFGKLVMRGGTDISTGKAFEGTMTAPSGSTVVNPITTLINQVSEKSGESADKAAEKVAGALGLDNEVDLLNYDPINEAFRTDTSDSEKDTALKVHKAATQLNTLVSQSAALLDGAGVTEDEDEGIDATYDSLADKVNKDGTLDLTEDKTINEVIKQAASEAGADEDEQNQVEGLAGDAAQTISNLTQAIEKALDENENPEDILVKIAQVQIVAETIEDSMEQGAEQGDVSDTTDDSQGDGFDSALDDANDDVGDVDGDNEDDSDGGNTSGANTGGSSGASSGGGTPPASGPTITSGSSLNALKETTGPNQVVYKVTSDDENATYTLAGTDAALFSIDENTGVVRLIENPDFEAKASYSFSVEASNSSGGKSSQSLNLAIEDMQSDVRATYVDGAIDIANSIGEIRVDNNPSTNPIDISLIGDGVSSGSLGLDGNATIKSLSLELDGDIGGGSGYATVNLDNDETEVLNINAHEQTRLNQDSLFIGGFDSLKHLNLMAEDGSINVREIMGGANPSVLALESIYLHAKTSIGSESLVNFSMGRLTQMVNTPVEVYDPITSSNVFALNHFEVKAEADSTVMMDSALRSIGRIENIDISATGENAQVVMGSGGIRAYYAGTDALDAGVGQISLTASANNTSVDVDEIYSLGGDVNEVSLTSSGNAATTYLNVLEVKSGDVDNIRLSAIGDSSTVNLGDSSSTDSIVDGDIDKFTIQASGVGAQAKISYDSDSNTFEVKGKLNELSLIADGDNSQAIVDRLSVYDNLNGSTNPSPYAIETLTIDASSDGATAKLEKLNVQNTIDSISVSASGANSSVQSFNINAESGTTSMTEVMINDMSIAASGTDSAVNADLYLNSNDGPELGQVHGLDLSTGQGSAGATLSITAGNGVGVDNSSTDEKELFTIDLQGANSSANVTINQEVNEGVISIQGEGNLDLTYVTDSAELVSASGQNLVGISSRTAAVEASTAAQEVHTITLTQAVEENDYYQLQIPGKQTLVSGNLADTVGSGDGVDIDDLAAAFNAAVTNQGVSISSNNANDLVVTFDNAEVIDGVSRILQTKAAGAAVNPIVPVQGVETTPGAVDAIAQDETHTITLKGFIQTDDEFNLNLPDGTVLASGAISDTVGDDGINAADLAAALSAQNSNSDISINENNGNLEIVYSAGTINGTASLEQTHSAGSAVIAANGNVNYTAGSDSNGNFNTIVTGMGDDVIDLSPSSGDSFVFAGAGYDQITASDGTDTFKFAAGSSVMNGDPNQNNDVINAMNSGDKLDFTAINGGDINLVNDGTMLTDGYDVYVDITGVVVYETSPGSGLVAGDQEAISLSGLAPGASWTMNNGILEMFINT